MQKKLKPAILAMTAALTAMVAHTSGAAPADSFTAPASSSASWYAAGRDATIKGRTIAKNTKKAKNVILFIGDGMGVSTITASRILQGQQPNIIGSNPTGTASSGEENLLSFEKFDWRALSKTYSVNQQTTDSAPSMTAMVTGIKNNDGELSVGQEIPRATTQADCNQDLTGHTLTTILEKAEDAGKATGLVSTARITHATPAATYAHTPNRDWEADTNQPAAGCAIHDIARQLVEFSHGDGIDVLFGGGRTYFFPNTLKDPEYPAKSGRRADGRNLITTWTTQYADGSYVYNNIGFDAIDPATANHVLGLFEPSHMQYEADRNTGTTGEPSLAAMSDKAIRILDKDPDGFFLHIEAGRIDHGHHAGNAYRALTDTIALSDAVEKTIATLTELGELENTLILITADHSHVFTIGGYPMRGNNILGKTIDASNPAAGYALASDSKPYTTLGYYNGAGFAEHQPADGAGYTPNAGRLDDLTAVDTTDKDFHQQSAVPGCMGCETHAAEDVPVFARGPWQHLVHGTIENNQIFHIMNTAFGFKK